MKNMRTLQKRIAYQLQQGSLDAEVTGITCDSRKVQPQNVFVCIRGNRMDGHVYAEEAVERGAAVLVAERELEGIPEKVTVLVVKDSRDNWLATRLHIVYRHARLRGRKPTA